MFPMILPFTWILCSLQLVSGTAVVELKFIDFINPEGKDNNGNICDVDYFGWQDCDHAFDICLDNNDGLNDTQSCPYGYKESEIIGHQNNLTFGSTFGGLENPLSFQINTWPGSMKLKLDVWDIDYFSKDHIEFFETVLTQAVHHSALAAKSVVHVLGTRTRLKVTSKVYCEPDYFGQKCDTHCIPHDDYRGHYTCNIVDGSRVCFPGWNGTYCDNNINECELYDPCNDTHICLDRLPGYDCVCPFGKTGDDCSATVVTCDENPCQNGGSCSIFDGHFKCTCYDGWSGDNCENILIQENNHQEPTTRGITAKHQTPSESTNTNGTYEHLVYSASTEAGQLFLSKKPKLKHRHIYIVAISACAVIASVLCVIFIVVKRRKKSKFCQKDMEIRPACDILPAHSQMNLLYSDEMDI